MTRCPSSIKKQRHSNKRSGNPSDYKHGMRGHAWEKYTQIIMVDTDSSTTLQYGRKCKNCGKVILNPIGEKYSS